VYFKQDTALETVQQLARNAGERPEVAEVKIVSSADALKEFREYSGFGTALEALEENPLPHVLHVRPAAFGSSPSQLEALKRYFMAWPEVDIVQMDSEWVIRFNAILDLMRRVLAIAAAILGLGVLAIIGNTIRLEILNRRAEIEVTKLVGGTNAFVRRPFLYTGVFYGLIGALLAWLVVNVGVAVLEEPVSTLAHLYGSRFVLSGPTNDDVRALLGSGIGIGWLGAWISSARHLRSIEPRA
jgi:cell division transport system permease protein